MMDPYWLSAAMPLLVNFIRKEWRWRSADCHRTPAFEGAGKGHEVKCRILSSYVGRPI